jgi:signal transduction histidine kinase
MKIGAGQGHRLKLAGSSKFGLLFMLAMLFLLLVFLFNTALFNMYRLGRDISFANNLAFYAAALFAMLGICSLAGMFFVKTVFRPICELSLATAKIASGDFRERIKPAGFDEVKDLANNFNAMACALEGAEMLKADFVDNVSHEFKTPLISIRGFAKLLRSHSGLPGSVQKEYLEFIIRESERLSKLSESILSLSKLQAEGNSASQRAQEEFSLDESLRQAILACEPLWRKKDISMAVELEDAVFWGNAKLLSQVWLNIIENSIKFTDKGGSIKVSLREATRGGGYAAVEIEDDGIGMDGESASRIFDRFYQADRSRSTPGNGLGMALAKKIVDISDGRISVESALGKGTKVTVLLPAGRARAHTSAAARR